MSAWRRAGFSGGGGTPPVQAAAINGDTSGDFTTASAAFVDVPGAVLSFTTAARRVKLGYVGTWLCDDATGVISFGFAVDGVQQGGGTSGLWRQRNPAVSIRTGVSLVFMTASLSAGAHTFKIQVLTTAGNLTVENNAANAFHFWAEECFT